MSKALGGRYWGSNMLALTPVDVQLPGSQNWVEYKPLDGAALTSSMGQERLWIGVFFMG